MRLNFEEHCLYLYLIRNEIIKIFSFFKSEIFGFEYKQFKNEIQKNYYINIVNHYLNFNLRKSINKLLIYPLEKFL